MSNGWRIDLNGTTLQGGDGDGDACLLAPPEGTGVPPQRTQDVTYPQRDGVEHLDDYYEPRIITALGLIGGGCQCTPPLVAAQALGSAWARRCDDTELVLWTGCEAEAHESILPNGDFTANSIAGWTGTNCALARSTTSFRSAPASLRATASSASLISLKYSGPAEAHRDYAIDAWMRTTGTTRSFTMTCAFYDSDGNLIDLGGLGSLFLVDGTFSHLTISASAPDGTVSYVLQIIQTSTNGNSTSGQVYYVDDVTVVPQIGILDRTVTGPFGVIGRPRVAEMPWRKGQHQVADGTFRFDATDHRLYVLDADGTPGSGALCKTLTGAPSATPSLYNSSAASPLAAAHHWPMDFPRLGPVSQSTINGARLDVVDMIGSYGGDLWAGYGVTNPDFPAQVVPPILYSLGISAIQGPATFQPAVYPTSYSSGMIGWWSYQDNTATSPAGMAVTISGSTIGKDNTGALAPVLNFPGLVNKAMNSLVKSAFGFDSGFEGQAVFVMVTWTATAVRIYIGTDDPSGSVILAQTETITSIPPANGVVQVFAIGAKFSNVIQGWNSYGTSSTNLTNAGILRDAAVDHADDSALVVPEVGQLCVPFQATIASTAGIGDVYIMSESGDYVGISDAVQNSDVYRASSLDTETGTAKRFSGLIDATNDILGDPFMTIRPGETLHVFGNGPDITICMRPAVLST